MIPLTGGHNASFLLLQKRFTKVEIINHKKYNVGEKGKKEEKGNGI